MEDVAEQEFYDLLMKTRSTCEGILVSGRSDIWSTYGALRRAREILHRILSHTLLIENEEDLVKYLVDQKQKAASTESSLNVDTFDATNLEQFVEDCLLAYNASSLIESCFLDGNKKRIADIYGENAFLRKRPCVLCLKICFAALEQNSLELFTSLNAVLATKEQFSQYLKEEQDFDTEFEDEGDRKPRGPSNTASLPSNSCSISSGDEHSLERQEEEFYSAQEDEMSSNSLIEKAITDAVRKESSQKRRSLHQEVLMTSALAAVMETNEDGLVWFNDEDRKSLLLEPDDAARLRITRMREISRSESSLFDEHGHIETEGSNVFPEKKEKEVTLQSEPRLLEDKVIDKDAKDLDEDMTPVMLRRSSNVLTTPFKRGHNRSKSDQIGVSKMNEALDAEDGQQEEKLSMSAPNSMNEDYHHEEYYYQPEDGYMFPKPYKGQSLISYLDSRSYDTGAELDKENAHFSICEALITAIEQMRCSKFFDSESDDSDEEIQSLKRKIKEKKLRKKLLKIEKQQAFSERSTSTASQSTSSSFFSGSTFSSSPSGSSTDQTIPQDTTSQKTLSRSWDNVSLSPNQSKTNMKNESTNNSKPEDSIKEDAKPESKPDDYSAEVVAKSLLKKFAGRKLPAASDLKWIVSEDQVPQSILPLPNAWPVSPDDAMINGSGVDDEDGNNMKNIRKASMPPRLRGNFEWAPPRPQIIFTAHPYLKRKELVKTQHYRCAGCGLKVTPSLSKRFRYCHYLGKYFCTSCHQNRMQLIPSKIINKWDFKQYPVSDFAHDFLMKMWKEPLFNILAIDDTIYKRIKVIDTIKELRLKLYYAVRFLKTCRHGESVYNDFQKSIASHIVEDIHLYSLEDFVQVKNGDLLNSLKLWTNNSLKHIKDCQLCKVKGFVCEYCRDFDDILYPFELSRVSTCPICKSCYHKSCFVPEKCPKCERIWARQRLLDSKSADAI